MNKFKSYLSGGIAPEGKARKPKGHWLWAASFGLALIFTVVAAQAEGPAHFRFSPIAVQDNTTRDFVPPTVFQAAGPSVASIQSSVDAFRADLGMNNGVGGTFKTGRREINWDAVPDAVAAPNNLPANFFNVNSPRGAVFSTDGTGFQVSANALNPTNTPVRFGNLNANYPSTFQTFSPQRLFTALGSNVTDVAFFIPGLNTPATVSGFGAVFTDVDQPDGSGPGEKHGNRGASTLVEFFGADGQLLFSSFVPSSPGDGSQSFFGIKFSDALIARVRITSGDAAPGPDDDSKNDIVMMDDFIYGEPQALP